MTDKVFPLIAVDRTEEYNNLNHIIQQFHQIQTVLYHGSSENSKLETILGLIEVNKILDESYSRAGTILKKYRKQLDLVAGKFNAFAFVLETCGLGPDSQNRQIL